MKFPIKTTTSSFTSTNQLELMKELVARPNAIFKSIRDGVTVHPSFRDGAFSIIVTSVHGLHPSLDMYADTPTEWQIEESRPLTLSEYLALNAPVVGEYCCFTDIENEAVQVLNGEFEPNVIRKLIAINTTADYPYQGAGLMVGSFKYAIPSGLFGVLK